jgi:23S rRNA (uracil1939-C5)-methyltransferase
MLRNNSLGEWMLVLSFGCDDEIKRTNLLTHIKQNFPQITSLLYVINEKLNDTIHDLEVKVFSGNPYLIEHLEDLQFKIGPKSFFQTNTLQTLNLYNEARQMAELTGKELVYDLYTGVGTIALFVAKMAAKVVGIEYVPQAIEDAKANAAFNQITHTHFYAGDMKDLLTNEFVEKNGKPDVVITDPPRAGMHEDVIQQLLLVEPKKIVYVSCNPATQARDIALMIEKYEVKKVQAVDMFPHTHHVENIALLELR